MQKLFANRNSGFIFVYSILKALWDIYARKIKMNSLLAKPFPI